MREERDRERERERECGINRREIKKDIHSPLLTVQTRLEGMPI